jgi:hypothetical protein
MPALWTPGDNKYVFSAAKIVITSYAVLGDGYKIEEVRFESFTGYIPLLFIISHKEV